MQFIVLQIALDLHPIAANNPQPALCGTRRQFLTLERAHLQTLAVRDGDTGAPRAGGIHGQGLSRLRRA